MTVNVLTQAQLDALKTSLKAQFNSGLAVREPEWKKIATVMPSDGKSNTYAWLSQFPAFREWVGVRLHKAVKERGFSVTNRLFENTLDIPRTDIEDDSFGQYSAVAKSYGESVLDLQNDLVFAALRTGNTSTCYDGQFFFDTDHPVAPNEDGSGTATTVSNYQDGTGAFWALLCTNRAAKALFLQERIKPQFESITSGTSEIVFEKDKYSFGGRWRGDAAYGFWQCAFGSRAELTVANFNAAVTAMSGFKADGNRRLGIVPDMLVVGSANRVAAKNLLLRELAGGDTNIHYKEVDLLVSSYLD